MLRDVIVAVLLIAGLGVQLLAVAGVALVPVALDRVHYLAASTLSTLLIATAVVVRESFSLIGIKALLVAAVIAFTAPTLSHITARAIHQSREGGGQG